MIWQSLHMSPEMWHGHSPRSAPFRPYMPYLAWANIGNSSGPEPCSVCFGPATTGSLMLALTAKRAITLQITRYLRVTLSISKIITAECQKAARQGIDGMGADTPV
jgi:hypothetical protein